MKIYLPTYHHEFASLRSRRQSSKNLSLSNFETLQLQPISPYLADVNLETKRLQIRQLTLADAPFFFELVNDQDWLQFIGDRNVRTIEDAENYLQYKIMTSYAVFGFGIYLVLEKESQTPLGIAGFVKRDELEHVDVGCAFLPKGRGKGYAFEAAKALMDYGTATFKFKTILAIANKDNVRSHHLLEKLGLSFQKYVQLNDEEEEICLFTFRSKS